MSNRGILHHDRLGVVYVIIDRRVARPRAFWKDDHVHYQINRLLSEAEIRRFLDDYSDQILRLRPECKLLPGTSLVCTGVEFRIVNSETVPTGKVMAYPNLPVTEVCVGPEVDPTSPGGSRAIKRVISNSAHALAPRLLLPRAKEIAAQVGLTVREWKIGRGARTLGTCDAHNRIILSSRLVFMPQELRDYIVLHELSHTVEHNHSARFHDLCNRLCGGREKELIKKLREFKFPL